MKPKTYAKLGLFTILGCVAIVATAFGLGLRSAHPEIVRYHSYFDESVQGLEIGSPVRYRGVSIGSVANIEIAPNRRHVDVSLSLKVSDVKRLGLVDPAVSSSKPNPASTRMLVPPDLRAQLGSQGITGVKFVNIDFFDPKTNPVSVLAFAADPNTIPAAASLMKGLEDSLAKALDRLPELLEGILASLGKVDGILDEVHEQRLPQALTKTLANLDSTVTDLLVMISHIDHAKLPEKTTKAFDRIDAAMAKVSAILERFDGDTGLVASTKRATDAVGDVSKTMSSSSGQLDRTLRDLSEAARSVRELADAVDRDPDMLVKGRARTP
jgi:phospholipid/cholesterol/gamma-HCH transport system substrate-binding protein